MENVISCAVQRNIFNSKNNEIIQLYFSQEIIKPAVFLSMNNEAQCIPLLSLSSRFIKYTSSFILGKFFIEKTSLSLGS